MFEIAASFFASPRERNVCLPGSSGPLEKKELDTLPPNKEAGEEAHQELARAPEDLGSCEHADRRDSLEKNEGKEANGII